MTIIVIERNNNTYNKDFRDRVIGGICNTFDAARELVFAHCEWGHEISVTSYVNNGTDYWELDRETGEIVKEYFVRALPGV